MQKIYFRADAGAEIGYGHFIRTLALADMLKDDFSCVFVTQAPTIYQKSEVAKVCELVEVSATEEKFRLFLDMLNGDEIVVLDNYFYDTDYQQKIRAKGCRLVCIDDMHNKHYVADVVINHGLTNENLFDTEFYTRLCLGLDWALLRAPFLTCQQNKRASTDGVKKVVLGFGGCDHWNLTGKVCSLLLATPDIEQVTAIIGDAYQHSYLCDPRLCYRKNLGAAEIAELFCKADLALLPASTMSFEALACGTVLATGYYVDNQVEIYHELVKSGRALPLDDFSDERLKQRLDQVLHLPAPATWKKGNIRKHYIELFHTLCFKNYRIGTFHFIDYRNLSEAQHLEVWQARTDSRICCWMSNQTIFSFESHLDFVNSLRSFSDRFFWAVYKDNCFLGSVNIHVMDSGYAERGIFMNPCLVGKAMAKEIEENAYSIYRNLGISVLKAKVRKNNIRSLKYHQKTGYSIECENEEYYFLIKILNEL